MSRQREKPTANSIQTKGAVPLWLGWLGLLILALIAYYPAVHGAMLWDDNAHVTTPELLLPGGLARIWFELGATQQYYPVLHSAFWLEHHLWGDAVEGYHCLNILLHTLSAGLIVLLMRRLALPGAWLGGALFALHPVCVESVAWISEQKNTLSTVFYLLAMLTWLRIDAQRDQTTNSTWRTYALATVLFIFAALTKTVTVTLPAALLVIAWWRRGKLSLRRDVIPLLPWFALAMVGGLMTAWVERTFIGAEGEFFALSWLQRTLLAGKVVWFYLGKLVWPADLVFIYPRWEMVPTVASHFIGLIAAIVTLVGFWLLRHRTRGPLAAALLFGGTLFPALGFFNVYPFQYSYVADHFQYLAAIAIFVSGSTGFAQLVGKLKITSTWGMGSAAVIVLGLLGTQTWRQAHEYQDNITLYRATLAKNPTCWMAAYNLGLELVETGHTQDAIASYEEALRLRPEYAEVHANLAMALLSQGDQAGALTHLQRAVDLKPTLWQARANLANVLMSTPGRQAEALPHYWRVAIQEPSIAWVRFNLGYALQAYPAYRQAALKQFHAALEIQPAYWEADYSIALLLINMPGRQREAIPHLEKAIALNPDLGSARELLDQLRR
jgi:protein O-mannosyl-transferase|uniref:tetratricopeptide repeat protein n=1 Tax=Cephaloticoccus sp. TaxID=1985742 RepID=UPI00404B4873